MTKQVGDSRPIGVFDSGVGGLTAVKELHRIMPEENIIYFGDTGRVPYGSRSSQTIRRYAAEIIGYLATYDVKAILAACGTVSSNFLTEDYDKLGLSIPYLTVVNPAVREAVNSTKNKKIGVVATTSSIRSEAYAKAIQRLDSTIQVTGQGCPLLISLVENGMTQPDNQITRLTLEMYLAPLLAQGVDTVILGCTHFPLLMDQIQEIMGESVALVDAGASAVRELRNDVAPNKSGQHGETKYYVTDTVEHFVTTAEVFLQEDISAQVTYVNPESIDRSVKK